MQFKQRFLFTIRAAGWTEEAGEKRAMAVSRRRAYPHRLGERPNRFVSAITFWTASVRNWYQRRQPACGFISPITLWLGKAADTQKFPATSNATKVGTNWSV